MSMLRVLFVAACLCALPPALRAGQSESGTSPGGHVHYEICPVADGKEIWIYRENEKGRINKMCETVDSDDLKSFFSPEDRWIIVQDGGASPGVSLQLFHREGEHSYAERDKAGIGAKVEVTALKQDGGDGKGVSEKRYAECLDWSADSQYILVRVSGKGDERYNHVRFRWIGMYAVEGGKVSTDLSKMNLHGVRRWPPGSTVSGLPFIGEQ